jgi:peptide/nickel transport system substrate-binding protein
MPSIPGAGDPAGQVNSRNLAVVKKGMQMRIKRKRAMVALAAVAALGLSACGTSKSSSDGGSTPQLDNKAIDTVVNASDAKGGTLKAGLGGTWGDSFDPGNTYYAYSWNMARNYARSLVMFKPAPGKASLELVPDVATDLGKPSDGGKTWTYTIQKGLKMEDGSPITTKEIAYAVSRTFDRAELKLGPSYLADLLNWPKDYKGPFKGPKDADISSAIETPDDSTIVFHLKQPFAEFDYLAALPQTAPVVPAKDTGSKYTTHPLSSGPYMWKGNADINRGGVLVRNPNWDASTDPNRKALPDEIDIKLGLQADDLDNQIIAGDQDLDIAGTGVQPAALPKVLQQKDLLARADNPIGGFLWFTWIIGTVKPLDNVDCRKAVMYAMSSSSYQNAYGGKFAGGEMASTVLPPTIPGYEKADVYGKVSHPDGQVDKAKAALKKCGQPDGFETTIGYRSSRDKEKAVAVAFQQSLGKAGIKVNVKPLADDTFSSETCGKPSYVVANKIGLCVYGWGADWPTGYGFLSQLVDSRVINPEGGSANFGARDPEIDKLIDQLAVEQDANKRAEISTEIDKMVMDQAFLYPGVYAKGVLLRGKNATNVFINDALSGQYDYTAIGVKQ